MGKVDIKTSKKNYIAFQIVLSAVMEKNKVQ